MVHHRWYDRLKRIRRKFESKNISKTIQINIYDYLWNAGEMDFEGRNCATFEHECEHKVNTCQITWDMCAIKLR